MARYRGVNGVAREVVKRYRGVNGVAREITKGYRGVNGVAREYFANETKIARASVIVSDSYGNSDKRFTSKGYWHQTASSDYWFHLVLNLYDSNDNLIEYETLDDIAGLESFSWTVETELEFYDSGFNRTENIFGHSTFSFEDTSQYNHWTGEFTFTKNNFKEKYIRVYHGAGVYYLMTVEFGTLYINGEAIPFTFSEW